MPDPTPERTGIMRHRAPTVLAVTAAVALAVAGCSDDSDTTSPSSSSSTSSAASSTTDDEVTDEQAYARAEDAAREHVAWVSQTGAPKPVPEDAEWVSDEFRASLDEMHGDLADAGVTQTGSTTITGIAPDVSNRDAVGGWDLTMHVCVTTDRRYIQDGDDVTVDADGEPLPKGERDAVDVYSFVTPDQGETWQVAGIQEVEGESCDAA